MAGAAVKGRVTGPRGKRAVLGGRVTKSGSSPEGKGMSMFFYYFRFSLEFYILTYSSRVS